jgi:hypothetical protein
MQAVVQRHLHPTIWDPGVIALLQWPAWLVALIPAFILLLLSRRGNPPIINGVNL